MNLSRLKLKILIVSFFFLQTPLLFGQIQLSRDTESYLKTAGYRTEKSPLTKAWYTEFPYNVEVNIPAGEDTLYTAILAATQEDFVSHKEFFADLLDFFRSEKFSFNIKIVLTAGDRQKIAGNERMSGTEIFCKNQEGAQNVFAILLDFNGRNSCYVTPGTKGEISPYYLTHLLCDSLDKNSAEFKIKGAPFVSLFRMGVLKEDSRLSSFLRREIPAVLLTLLGEDNDYTKEVYSLKDFFSELEPSRTDIWCRHYIPIVFPKKILWVGETTILSAIISFMLIVLFALSDFNFLFRKRSRRLAEIKAHALKSIHVIFLTAAILTLASFAGQGLARFVQRTGIRNIMILFMIKLSPAFILVSVLYPLEIKLNKNLPVYIYEYILTISAVLNIFIFTLLDISLFFLFALQYLILVISRAMKNALSIYLFILIFIAPFIPVIYVILVYSDAATLTEFVFSDIHYNIMLSFAIIPFNLLWLRILARLNLKATSYRSLVARYVISSIINLIGIILVASITITVLEKTFFKNVEPLEQKARVLDSENCDFTKVSAYDTEYYGGKIRRIDITTARAAERIRVYARGQSDTPVDFSIYDTATRDTTTEFLLPDNPPQKLSVIFTPDPNDSGEITVEAYFMSSQKAESPEPLSCIKEKYIIDAQDLQ